MYIYIYINVYIYICIYIYMYIFIITLLHYRIYRQVSHFGLPQVERYFLNRATAIRTSMRHGSFSGPKTKSYICQTSTTRVGDDTLLTPTACFSLTAMEDLSFQGVDCALFLENPCWNRSLSQFSPQKGRFCCNFADIIIFDQASRRVGWLFTSLFGRRLSAVGQRSHSTRMQEPQNLRGVFPKDAMINSANGGLGRAEGANVFKRWMDKNCYCPVGVDPRDLRLRCRCSQLCGHSLEWRGSIVHRPWFPLQKRFAKVPSYQIGLQSHRKVPYRKFGFHKIRWGITGILVLTYRLESLRLVTSPKVCWVDQL